MSEEFSNEKLSEIFLSITGTTGDSQEFRRYKEAVYRESNYEKPNVQDEYRKVVKRIKAKRQRRIYYVAGTAVAASLMLFGVFLFTAEMQILPKTNIAMQAEVESLGIVRSSSNVLLQTSKGLILLDDKVAGKVDTTKFGVEMSYQSNLLTYSNETLIPETESGLAPETHTLIVPRGALYEAILSDGTVVKMNSESQLKYPVLFVGDKRVVELVGEAYFKVAKDTKMPFFVKTRWATTEVLGTEFNASSYENDELNITLVEGSVKIESRSELGVKNVVLRPGENAELCSINDQFNVTTVDVQLFTSWMNGYFFFEWERLEDILIKLKRWYDFDVQYQNENVKNYLFRFRADRGVPFDIIFKRLEATKRIKLVVDGKLIYVNDVVR